MTCATRTGYRLAGLRYGLRDTAPGRRVRGRDRQEAAFVIGGSGIHACLLLWAGGQRDRPGLCGRYPQGHARYNRITRGTAGMRRARPCGTIVVALHTGHERRPQRPRAAPRGPRRFQGGLLPAQYRPLCQRIGYHGCPAVSSLRRFLSPGELWPMEGAQWLVHNTEHPRYRRATTITTHDQTGGDALWRSARELADFAFASQ